MSDHSDDDDGGGHDLFEEYEEFDVAANWNEAAPLQGTLARQICDSCRCSLSVTLPQRRKNNKVSSNQQSAMVSVLPCSHCFHTVCLDEYWSGDLEFELRCPVFRGLALDCAEYQDYQREQRRLEKVEQQKRRIEQQRLAELEQKRLAERLAEMERKRLAEVERKRLAGVERKRLAEVEKKRLAEQRLAEREQRKQRQEQAKVNKQAKPKSVSSRITRAVTAAAAKVADLGGQKRKKPARKT